MYWPFDEAKMRSILCLAGLEVSKVWKLPNGYWGNSEEVNKVSPWWLAKTQFGLIQIGARKRVLNIDWSDTGIGAIVTEDDVTKSMENVHAYTELKAVEYLKTFVAKAAAMRTEHTNKNGNQNG